MHRFKPQRMDFVVVLYNTFVRSFVRGWGGGHVDGYLVFFLPVPIPFPALTFLVSFSFPFPFCFFELACLLLPGLKRTSRLKHKVF
ncbi:hypothetical protein DFP72DRAFT_875264 [Ephemerocybe angulata]|uniref:Transmembrane protein n=1 Tax=Ephemerocybe angulata TaxID=980116 RepID=A0A8H6IFL0_9AGAR|nr:hypothetical protein DFP72DRAFT_875264 [Tulosesus angulatus]